MRLLRQTVFETRATLEQEAKGASANADHNLYLVRQLQGHGRINVVTKKNREKG